MVFFYMYFYCNIYKIFIIYIIFYYNVYYIYKYYKLKSYIYNIFLHNILLVIFAFKKNVCINIIYFFLGCEIFI